MIKKKKVKLFLWTLNFLVIFLLIWSLVNYQFLNQSVGTLVQIWGLIAMVLFIIILEGAPVFVGPGMGVAAVLAMGVHNPWLVLVLFLSSALIGNIFYFYLGHNYGRRMLKYFDKEVKKYCYMWKDGGQFSTEKYTSVD